MDATNKEITAISEQKKKIIAIRDVVHSAMLLYSVSHDFP